MKNLIAALFVNEKFQKIMGWYFQFFWGFSLVFEKQLQTLHANILYTVSPQRYFNFLGVSTVKVD